MQGYTGCHQWRFCKYVATRKLGFTLYHVCFIDVSASVQQRSHQCGMTLDDGAEQRCLTALNTEVGEVQSDSVQHIKGRRN
jgi:hypothetical protein